MKTCDQIAKEIVLRVFSWEVHEDGSVGVELRGANKCLSDLNLDAETEIFIRRTIRDHISYKIVMMGAKCDARTQQVENERNERLGKAGGV